jgi:hypothetical protein
VKIIDAIKSLFSNISRIIYWIPVIWKDRNWDDKYIFIILNHKLKDMEKFFIGDGTRSLDPICIAYEINHAQTILQRLIDHNYLSVALEEYDKKYEFDTMMKFEKVEGSENLKVVWTKDDEQMAMFRKAGEEAYEAEQRDLDELFSYMRKHIERWWD